MPTCTPAVSTLGVSTRQRHCAQRMRRRRGDPNATLSSACLTQCNPAHQDPEPPSSTTLPDSPSAPGFSPVNTALAITNNWVSLFSFTFQ